MLEEKEWMQDETEWKLRIRWIEAHVVRIAPIPRRHLDVSSIQVVEGNWGTHVCVS